MRIILKNNNGEFIKTISLEELIIPQKTFENLILMKQLYEANVYAIDETINTYQFIKFINDVKKLNIRSVHIYSNNRLTILTGKSLKIDSTFVNKKDLRRVFFLSESKKQQDVTHMGTVRSGERISSNGNLVIIGDVNPGAIVTAKKNVYVWGKLLGIALAGEGGNKNASIASLYLSPLQLRISGVVAIGPKDKPKNNFPEIATLKNQSIIIKPCIMKTLNKTII